jgi:hypothetical protein
MLRMKLRMKLQMTRQMTLRRQMLRCRMLLSRKLRPRMLEIVLARRQSARQWVRAAPYNRAPCALPHPQ